MSCPTQWGSLADLKYDWWPQKVHRYFVKRLMALGFDPVRSYLLPELRERK